MGDTVVTAMAMVMRVKKTGTVTDMVAVVTMTRQLGATMGTVMGERAKTMAAAAMMADGCGGSA